MSKESESTKIKRFYLFLDLLQATTIFDAYFENLIKYPPCIIVECLSFIISLRRIEYL